MSKIDQAKWDDNEAYYDGPVDHDVSGCGMELLAAFWADSLAFPIEQMRSRWAQGLYRGLPPSLAKDLMTTPPTFAR